MAPTVISSGQAVRPPRPNTRSAGLPVTPAATMAIKCHANQPHVEDGAAGPGEPREERRIEPPPPASALMEELVEEVLLRFPPADLASLVRAVLVCRRWRRIVMGPRFHRRYRELHLHRGRGGSSPPMLGFLADTGAGTRFVPTSTFRPAPAPGGGLLLVGWRTSAATTTASAGDHLDCSSGSPQQPCLAAPAASAADPPGSAGGSPPRARLAEPAAPRREPRLAAGPPQRRRTFASSPSRDAYLPFEVADLINSYFNGCGVF
ncbi:uncharacterized protein [Miscanthus floridulus]|uniref:uncharacterized protein n=1 Tax=Miscanthus floridulus TaxID=154761 RepID=UPI00345A06E8